MMAEGGAIFRNKSNHTGLKEQSGIINMGSFIGNN